MPPRARRAVAALGVMVFLAAYVWAVIAVGAFIPDHWLAQLAFYAMAGVAWGAPILPLLTWAERGGRK